MYSVKDYGDMIMDRVRMTAYEEALRHVVTDGCTVLDIGSGTGIFTMLACQYGAGHVYALETNDAIIIAEEIARANGYGDQITFMQALSTDITLPQPVDVIVSDLRGMLPLYTGNIGSLIDARKRLLKPNGKLIPQHDTLLIAPVHAPNDYQRFVGAWQSDNYPFDMRAAQKITLNTWSGMSLEGLNPIADAQPWALINYQTVEATNATGVVEWELDEDSVSHGFCMWFETRLWDDIGYSTFNREKQLIYGNAFFPFLEPIALQQGDMLRIEIDANEVNNEYIWTWQTQVERPTQSDQPIINYKQSNFFGAPLSLDKLRRRSASYIPQINHDGQMVYFVLDTMQQTQSLEQIARQLLDRFPDKFASYEDALPYVSKLSEKYSI